MKTTTLAAACTLILTLSAPGLRAAPLMDLISIGGGNTGAFTVGYEFSVDRTVTVTHLGRFDFGGAGFTSAAAAALWKLDQTQLVSTSVPFGGGAAGYREADTPATGVFYRPVAPTTLSAGTYVLGVESGAEAFATQPSSAAFATGFSWIRARAESGTALVFPNGIQHTIATAYYGPNLQFANGAHLQPASYAYDGSGQGSQPSTAPSFPDTGMSELIDGLFPATTAFTDAGWVGFQDAAPDDGTSHPQVTFDFGATLGLRQAVVTYLHSTTQAGGSITAPEEVLVSYSPDGAIFSAPTSYTSEFNSADGDEIRSAFLDLDYAQGRYVRMDFRNASQWTFLSEVSFTAVPEPSSFTMLLLGGVVWGLVRRFRIA